MFGSFFNPLGVLDLLTNKKGRDSANAATQADFASALAQLQGAQDVSRLFSGLGSAQQARGIQDIRTGYQDAMNRTRAAAESGRVSIARLGAGAEGRSALATYNRGLNGTSAGAAMATTARGRTEQSLAELERLLAETESRLAAGQGSALAQQRNVLAGGYNQAAQNQLATARALAELFSSREHVAYNPLQDIIGAASAVGQLGMGGII